MPTLLMTVIGATGDSRANNFCRGSRGIFPAGRIAWRHKEHVIRALARLAAQAGLPEPGELAAAVAQRLLEQCGLVGDFWRLP